MFFKNIVIAGAGVQGSQLAVQIAFTGYPVTVWVRNEDSKKRAEAKISAVASNYKNVLLKAKEAIMSNNSAVLSQLYCKSLCSFDEFCDEDKLGAMLEAIDNLSIIIETTTDVFKNADLIVETIKEDVEVKKTFYNSLVPLVNNKVIITTNSSSYAPSMFIKNVPDSSRYLMMHFASPVIKCDMAEIMCHNGDENLKPTNKKVADKVYDFAKSIGMSPTRIEKEIPRGVLNFMIIPWMAKAAYLWGSDISSPQDIDKTWMAGTMHCVGPFMLMDAVGLNIVYEILMTMDGVTIEGHPFNVVKNRIETMMSNNEKFYK